MSVDTVIDKIRHYQRSIEKCSEKEERILYCIEKLFHLPVTVPHLRDTGVGRTVNGLRKYNGVVGDASKALVAKWKEMVAQEDSSGEEEEEGCVADTSETYKDSPDSPPQTDISNRNHEKLKQINEQEKEMNSKLEHKTQSKSKENQSSNNSREQQGGESVSNNLKNESEKKHRHEESSARHSHGTKKRNHDSIDSKNHKSVKKRKEDSSDEQDNKEKKHNNDSQRSRSNHSHKNRVKVEVDSEIDSSDESTESKSFNNVLEGIDRSHSRKHSNKNDKIRDKSKESKHKSDDKKHSSKHRKEENHRSQKEKSDDNRESRRSKSHREKDKKKDRKSEKSKSKSSKELGNKMKQEIDGNEGIDCNSGTSFADALGMCTIPSVSNKKRSNTLGIPTGTKMTKPDPVSSPPSSFVSKTDACDDKQPVLLSSNIKLEPLSVDLASTLPEISPNYKPLPYVEPVQRKRNDFILDDAIYSKNQRTKVYSGNKSGYSTVSTLYDMCIRVLIENIDALEFTGGIPYDILKPILERANPKQLENLEYHNAYLMVDTDILWEQHCKQQFRNKQRQEMESWREMYMRCSEEREEKLKMLTANYNQATSPKPNKAKLAYIDNIVKPPRNVLKKQAKYGTGNSTALSSSDYKKALITSGGSNLVTNITVPPPPMARIKTAVTSVTKKTKAPLMAKALQLIRGRYKR